MGGRVSSPTFVGRVEELRVLQAARVRATNGEPAVVLVGGEAGVGKSRLVAELAARCTADGMGVLAGGCVPVGEGALPYAPIVEALRVLVAELGAGAVRELVGSSWPELARLVPSLGEPPASGPPGEAAQARVFELLLGLLGRLGRRAPMLLIVEDLHWADRSTRDMLAFLVRNLRRERILVMVTYRDDEPGLRWLGPWLAELDRGGHVERIELRRLDQVQTAAQLVGILGTAPPTELVDAVFARSEGNPFFTEELLTAVRTGSRELPATLRDLLRGRVQALPQPAQHVLGVVAVAGRPVPHRLLAKIAGVDDLDLDAALRAGVAHQLLIIRPDQDGYDLRHALLREVIDTGLLPGERARLHAAIARVLAELPELANASPAVATAELAAHWDAAGVPAQALPARVQAGLAAEQAHAFAAATRHYQRALELWDRVPDAAGRVGVDLVALQSRCAEAAYAAGEPDRAAQLVRQALPLVDQARQPQRAGLLHEQLARYLRMFGDPGALGEQQQAVRLVPSDPSPQRARVLGSLAQLLVLVSRHAEAREVAEEAIAIAGRVGAQTEEANARTVLGSALIHLGDADAGLAELAAAVRLATQAGDVVDLLRAIINHSDGLLATNYPEEAARVALDGIQQARRLGLARSYGVPDLATNATEALVALGRWDQAEHVSREALEFAPSDQAWVNLPLARAALELGRGDLDGAAARLRTLQRLLPAPIVEPQRSGPLFAGLAEVALWRGHLEQAKQLVAEAVRLAAASPRHAAPLYALGLRVEADRAELARARHPGQPPGDDGTAEALLERLHQAAVGPARGIPELAAWHALGLAERTRQQGPSDPAAWAAAAATWERLGQPYRAAYAGFRQAEALLAVGAPRQQAEAVLRSAHQTTVALGAAPLRREVELLAQRARLRLDAHAGATATAKAPAPAESLGLTRREAEVLMLLTEGRTNRQIARVLFITEKTASVHVSNIMGKLGAANRSEAAAIAHRLRLDKR